ncbi:MAG: hypothetical protein ABTQ34_09965 [Bdellovibrionales bacterium]
MIAQGSDAIRNNIVFALDKIILKIALAAPDASQGMPTPRHEK